MSSTQVVNERGTQLPSDTSVDLKLEVVILPVSDVERSKRFYEGLGWKLDADFSFDNGLRVVQITPPGSACSIQFGTNITSAAPGTARDIYLVVSDIQSARDTLVARGAEVSEIFHPTAPGGWFEPRGASGRDNGPAPDHASYLSFATFSDPDGNSWLIQEVKTRLAGRGLSNDVATLIELLADAEQRHGEYERKAPKHHWSEWYAGYIIARQRGRTSDEAAIDAAQRMEAARDVAHA